MGTDHDVFATWHKYMISPKISRHGQNTSKMTQETFRDRGIQKKEPLFLKTSARHFFCDIFTGSGSFVGGTEDENNPSYGGS